MDNGLDHSLQAGALGPGMLDRSVIDHMYVLLLENFAGQRRCQELVVRPAHAPATVEGLRLLIAQAGMHRPFVESGGRSRSS